MTKRVRVVIEVDTDLSKGAFRAMLMRNIRTIDPFAGDNVVYIAAEYDVTAEIAQGGPSFASNVLLAKRGRV